MAKFLGVANSRTGSKPIGLAKLLARDDRGALIRPLGKLAEERPGDVPTREEGSVTNPRSQRATRVVVTGPGLAQEALDKVGSDSSTLARFFYCAMFDELEKTAAPLAAQALARRAQPHVRGARDDVFSQGIAYGKSHALDPLQKQQHPDTKLAAREVDLGEALRAQTRLKDLEKSKATPDQLVRGAAVGAAVGPLAGTLSNTIGGSWRPGGLRPNVRSLAGSAATGAVFGGVMPHVRHKVEEGAERKKIRTFLTQHTK